MARRRSTLHLHFHHHHRLQLLLIYVIVFILVCIQFFYFNKHAHELIQNSEAMIEKTEWINEWYVEETSMLQWELQEQQEQMMMLSSSSQKEDRTTDKGAIGIKNNNSYTDTNGTTYPNVKNITVPSRLRKKGDEWKGNENQRKQSNQTSATNNVGTNRRNSKAQSSSVTTTSAVGDVDATSNSVVWPSISIVGIPKCGTSHMYKILASHKDACSLHPQQKEFCMRFYDSENSYLQNMTMYLQMARKKNTVNGCISINEAFQFRHLAIESRTKHIVLLRDPADMMWASYNFWALPEEKGEDGQIGDWANPLIHLRSPKLFHEIYKVESGFWRDPPTDKWGVKFPIYTKAMINAFGKENVLFIKSEDMKNPTKIHTFVKQLSNFTGLSYEGFSQKHISTMTNCGDSRGETKSCNQTTATSSRTSNNDKDAPVYSISNYQPMLGKSRTLVYKRWWKTCKYWAEHLDVEYEDCLRDGAPTRSPTRPVDILDK